MTKSLFGGSLICVISLMLGSFFFPHSILMELADTSVATNIFRAVVTLLLFSVIVTNPPRSFVLRICMGVLATVLLGTGIAMSFSGGMHLLDAILYLQLGCVLGTEALEFNESDLLDQAKKLQALYQPATEQARAK